MKRYNPKEIEQRWQKAWEDQKLFHVSEQANKPKKYVIDMFPYPSGAAMHVGHVRNFTISDVLSQYLRQKGYNVLHTMGWDTFGLPAENYAIKTGTPPAESTKANIANFKHQLRQLGMSYDWSREVNTSDPEYYRWTQWIFLQLFKNGLAYQAENPQWWCPVDKTVLANEQVESGKCWRCGSEVIKKSMKQWFFKITDYADQLLEGIDDLAWPEKIKTMQRNWIGKSQGAEIDFKTKEQNHTITVFTTRADTIFSGAFLVLAPEHPLAVTVTSQEQKSDVDAYIKEAVSKSDLQRMAENDKDKSGVFTGAYAINPANNEEIPVWIADFVLGSYGTGAVFGDIHDERDFEFLKKYGIPARVTVIPEDRLEAEKVKNKEFAYTGEGVLIDSGEFSGQRSEVARDKIIAWLAQQGAAREKVNYKMRDWLISRQRYWGAPIPIIHCAEHGAVAVPEDQLPVILPEVKSFEPTGEGSALQSATEWVNVNCPSCGQPAKRETDTMDGYACSSWYFLRYTDPNNGQKAWEPEKANYWLPIDYYCGGDHAVSHLLYSRFWMRFFADQGWIEKSRQEPVGRLVYNGYILAHDGNKMSKSKGNVVNPDDLIEQGYGADSLRLFEMFIAPYEQNTNWNTNGVPGTFRFLQRFWTLVQEFLDSEPANAGQDDNVLRTVHSTIAKVSHDLDNLHFNTAVASLMEAVNELYKTKAEKGYKAAGSWQFALDSLTQLLAPFAPHITEELWQQLGHAESVHVSSWPVHDEKYLTRDTVAIVVQINGKVRAQLELPAGISEEDAVAAAREDPKIISNINNQAVRKTIYVPQKLINFVI